MTIRTPKIPTATLVEHYGPGMITCNACGQLDPFTNENTLGYCKDCYHA